MSDRGLCIICRLCLFPIRLPRTGPFLRNESGRIPPILLACPACAHVQPHQAVELRTVHFRLPDPFRENRAVLYRVEVPCAIRRCESTANIYAAAAASISLAALLKLWKYWAIHRRCQGHPFRPMPCATWGISTATDMLPWAPPSNEEPIL
jgi:hypothetical protein